MNNLTLLNIETKLLSVFPVIYILALYPGKLADVFVLPRLCLLATLVVVCFIIRFFTYLKTDKGTNKTGLVETWLGLPVYLKLLPILFFTMLISIVNSPDTVNSWLGQDGNRVGGLYLLLLIPLFWIYATSKSQYKVNLGIVGIILSLISIVEYIGFRPLDFITSTVETLKTSFPAATVGYRGQLAGLLILLCTYNLVQYQKSRNIKKGKIISAASIVLGIVALGCTTNSTAFVAWGIAVLAFVLTGRKLKVLSLNWLIAGLILLIPLQSYRILLGLNKYLVSMGLVSQTSDAKNQGNPSTFKTRQILWKAGFSMAFHRPIMGWGPQNFYSQWYNFLPDKDIKNLVIMEMGIKEKQYVRRKDNVIMYHSSKNPGKDEILQVNYFSAHNAYLDWFISFGLLGLAVSAWILIDIFREVRKNNPGPLFILAILPILAYGIYLLAWFITVPVGAIALIILTQTMKPLRPLEEETEALKQIPAAL